jgi:hypothetical protein
MTKEEKLKQQREELKQELSDPLSSNRKLYNPSTGDLYITTADKQGRIRRSVINLLS